MFFSSYLSDVAPESNKTSRFLFAEFFVMCSQPIGLVFSAQLLTQVMSYAAIFGAALGFVSVAVIYAAIRLSNETHKIKMDINGNENQELLQNEARITKKCYNRKSNR